MVQAHALLAASGLAMLLRCSLESARLLESAFADPFEMFR